MNNFLKEHAVYQIYPVSFKDSNNDGYGDLKGIISKLDYLKDLGIKIIWLSPIYESPMMDFGYDISDYRKINPLFGTMDDFDELIIESQKRGIKIIMDLVVNHTSDQHNWFKQAIKDKNSPYRDYYIFKEGKKDKNGKYTYPNNWTSNFTGPAWEEVPNEKGMYYLHIFTKQQPDLNWHNPKILQEVEDIISFWMNKGVYGFRCDVISEIFKTSFDDGKKQNSTSPIGIEHYLAQPGNHDILKKIKKDVIEPHNGVLIGECGGPITVEDGQKFLDNELDTFFEFDIANADFSLFRKRINPKAVKPIIIHWQENVDWNGNYLENHNQHRVFNRYVYGKNEIHGSKMLLTMQFTLRGTPFIYNGQEYAAHDYPKPLPINECRDCVTQFIYALIHKQYHLPSFLASKMAHKMGRDDERAPMAFTGSDNYGFSTVKPWQRYNPMGKLYNVESALKDPDSVLNFFKKINSFREGHNVLTYGTIEFKKFDNNEKDVLIYTRCLDDKQMLIVLNLSNKKRTINSKIKTLKKELLLSNYSDSASYLRPYEALIYSF